MPSDNLPVALARPQLQDEKMAADSQQLQLRMQAKQPLARRRTPSPLMFHFPALLRSRPRTPTSKPIGSSLCLQLLLRVQVGSVCEQASREESSVQTNAHAATRGLIPGDGAAVHAGNLGDRVAGLE